MPSLKVKTAPQPLRKARVRVLRGREQLSAAFEYVVRLGVDTAGDANENLDVSKLLGQPFTIAVESEVAPTRYVSGVLTEFSQGDYGLREHLYELKLRPSLWLLTRSSDCRVFQNKTTPEIIADVCKGRVEYRLDLSGHYDPWDYRVQYGETDFDFVSRLLEHEGILYYFEHSADKHVLVLTDDTGKLAAQGCKEIPYRPYGVDHAGDQRQEKIREWFIGNTFEAAAFASLEYNFETPADAVRAASAVPMRKDTGVYELFEYPAGATKPTTKDVERIAKVRAEQLQGAQHVIRSKGDALWLAPGKVFKLKDHPHSGYGSWRTLVVSSDLEFTSWSEEARPGDNDACEIIIVGVPDTTPYRPRRITPRPIVHGAQTARVVGPQGKEIWTDKFGRVKVQFHWDRKGKSDDASSCWVRVASSWAGKNWGAQFLPRVGQEVLVSFLEGDPDRPVVIGSVYNGQQMPPYDLPANGTRSGVKTRSSAEGAAGNFNELSFEDKKGSEEIYLHAEKDMRVVVRSEQMITVGIAEKDKGNRTTLVRSHDKLTVGKDLTVEIEGRETHTVHEDRSSTLKANDALDVGKAFKLTAGDQISLECGLAKIVMKKDGTIEISGKDVKVKGTASASVDGTQAAVSGTQVDVKGTKTAIAGSGTLDLSSGGIASLKGSLTKIG